MATSIFNDSDFELAWRLMPNRNQDVLAPLKEPVRRHLVEGESMRLICRGFRVRFPDLIAASESVREQIFGGA